MSKHSKNLEPNGGAGFYAPATEDDIYTKYKVLLRKGEDWPSKPKIIKGKQVIKWIQVP